MVWTREHKEELATSSYVSSWEATGTARVHHRRPAKLTQTLKSTQNSEMHHHVPSGVLHLMAAEVMINLNDIQYLHGELHKSVTSAKWMEDQAAHSSLWSNQLMVRGSGAV